MPVGFKTAWLSLSLLLRGMNRFGPTSEFDDNQGDRA